MIRLWNYHKMHGAAFYRVLIIAGMLLAIFTACDNKQLKIGDTAPDISGKDLHGDAVGTAQLRGKIAIIYFWTNSCCGDCLKKVEPLYIKNKDKGLAVLAVNEGDNKEIVESYTKANGITFTMLIDEKIRLLKQYQVFGFPSIFILDQNGIIREKILGDMQIEKLQKLVDKQLDIRSKAEEAYEKNRSR